MSQLPAVTPSAPTPDPAAKAATSDLDPILHGFWEKNSSFITGICVVALVVLVVRSGWQYYTVAHAASVQADFAAADNNAGKLTAFAADNAGSPLAGVANLKVADAAYNSGDFTGAGSAYQKAAGSLKNEALLGRAKLGAAMSAIAAGDQSSGEAALKALGTDSTVLKSVRAEATYHLASLAATAGRIDEARKFVDQVAQIDPTGGWSQRATLLLTTLPVGPVKPASTGVNFSVGK